MDKKYNNYRKYDLGDLLEDHPIIFGCITGILTILAFAGIFTLVHKFELERIEHQKEIEIEETIEKAKICQETGYCNSKNINIDYANGGEDE